MQHLDNKEIGQQKQQHSLAKDRMRREIKPPQRYTYIDLVANALSVERALKMRILDLS